MVIRPTVSQRQIRVGVAVALLIGLVLVVPGYVESHQGYDYPTEVPPSDGITVIASQASQGTDGALVAYAPNGSRIYHDQTYRTYFDVDPSPEGERTVLALAARPYKKNCPTSCYELVVFHANLTTGDRTILYRTLTSGSSPRWHDVDRLNDTHYVIGDIEHDRVTVLDTRTGELRSLWLAAEDYPPSSGGNRFIDWTHLNDVEALPDGRIMVSLRNQDSVIFLNRDGTIDHPWTLGSDDDHGTLYEQHNPDYIPETRGGPAILVADSENNRILEYQRSDGEWKRSWVWQDAKVSWPRDADRLPSGETLIADSTGNRVLIVNQSGAVTWSMAIHYPYDAERLETGDESTGGESAQRLGLESREYTPDLSSGGQGISPKALVSMVVPAKVIHGLQFITPWWVGVVEFIGLVILVGGLVVGLVTEIRRTDRVQFRSPVVINSDNEE